jgi:iron complex transport system substrate-binding protein
MILLFRTVAVLLAVAALATGCSDSSPDSGAAQPETTTPAATMSPSTTAPAPPGFPVTVIAANGTIEIPEQPSRIVSMSATHTEILFAIGAGDQVVAVDAFSDFPPEAPVTDLTGFAPNVEAIIEYDTDLVVTDGDWDGSSMETLTELGVPVLILPAAETLDEVYGEIEALGAATGHRDRAAALAAAMRSEIDAILRDVPEWSEPPTFYHELDSTYYSVTSDTFIGHLYVLLGLENIADSVGDGSSDYPQLSEEYILQEDPDLIFLADTICCDVSAETLAERPGWDGLTAVENGAVVELDDDVSSRWGPRIVDHLRAVSTAIAALAVE